MLCLFCVVTYSYSQNIINVDSIDKIVDTISISSALVQSTDSIFHRAKYGVFTDYYVDDIACVKYIDRLERISDSVYTFDTYFYYKGKPIYAERLSTTQLRKFYFSDNAMYELINKKLVRSDDGIEKNVELLRHKVGSIIREVPKGIFQRSQLLPPCPN